MCAIRRRMWLSCAGCCAAICTDLGGVYLLLLSVVCDMLLAVARRTRMRVPVDVLLLVAAKAAWERRRARVGRLLRTALSYATATGPGAVRSFPAIVLVVECTTSSASAIAPSTERAGRLSKAAAVILKAVRMRRRGSRAGTDAEQVEICVKLVRRRRRARKRRL